MSYSAEPPSVNRKHLARVTEPQKDRRQFSVLQQRSKFFKLVIRCHNPESSNPRKRQNITSEKLLFQILVS